MKRRKQLVIVSNPPRWYWCPDCERFTWHDYDHQTDSWQDVYVCEDCGREVVK